MRRWTSFAINITMGLLILVAFALAFFWVPPAKEFAEKYGNGHIAKIVFVHVPLAIVSFLAFIFAAGFGVAYLIKRNVRWDDISYALVEIGWLYAVLATATGAYFSKLAWGEWWSWDPRQTTMFLVLLTYTAYLLVRASIEDQERKASISAVYAILGAIASVFFYWVIPYLPTVMAVSAHPSGIIARGGLDFSYKLVLRLSFLGFLLAFVQLVRIRASILRLERQRIELALKEMEV
ncbi:MAG: cytochrome c biogenesis protein [Armatimonadetes bacterium]|nr:cytochrome c biogenesis protein [Armatimonadota bacterium]MDW8029018.1 cytochrome c biogenesis protein CcsA [Armatimonadota bacterium]